MFAFFRGLGSLAGVTPVLNFRTISTLRYEPATEWQATLRQKQQIFF